MASVGTHIKRLRGAKRMTQEELAAQLHVTRQAVSAWETGKALPDVEMLERIAAALGSDVTEVIYGAKSAPDLTALKRKWVRQGIGWGLWLAIGYYILFCCGVWGSWTQGLSYQFSAPWRGTLVTGCMNGYLDSRYYRTDKTAGLTITVKGEQRTAGLIGNSVLDRDDVNFGYTLFSGTGDPEELPENVTLTLTGLLRLTAGYRRG